MSDLNCPYCNCGQEVCHDDGFGYEEDTLHEMECSDCGKLFTFFTSIIFNYESKKADCLNGKEHVLKPSVTYPAEYTVLNCETCEYSQVPTPEELAEIIAERESK